MNILRTDSSHKDFQTLVKSLDAALAEHNGENDDFFAQFNTIDTIKNCIVAYIDDIPAACGAFKPFSEDTIEIKECLPILISEKRIRFRYCERTSKLGNRIELYKSCIGNFKRDLKSAISVYEKSGFTKYLIMVNTLE